ncbi:MAG: CRISPR-associated protein Cas4 [Bacteroidota bacterium]
MTATNTLVSGTQIAYYHLCHRKVWLHTRHIRMENATSNRHVEEGKLLGDTTYNRRPQKWRELDLGVVKIDHFDTSTNTIREIKKSPKLEHAHVAQVQYYLYVLEQRGISGATGIIEYPRQRKTTSVILDAVAKKDIQGWLSEIKRISQLPECPKMVRKSYCKQCAFYDFCFV